MDDKEKVIALYNYIAEVSKSLKDTKINFTEEKWFLFFSGVNPNCKKNIF